MIAKRTTPIDYYVALRERYARERAAKVASTKTKRAETPRLLTYDGKRVYRVGSQFVVKVTGAGPRSVGHNRSGQAWKQCTEWHAYRMFEDGILGGKCAVYETLREARAALAKAKQ